MWAEHVTCVRENRKLYWFLVGKPEGKGQLGRPRREWEGNVKMNLFKTVSTLLCNLYLYISKMWHVWGTGEVRAEFRLGDLRERDHLEDLGVVGIQY
jgi:hypothetical protein